jgi:hypothetical protein
VETQRETGGRGADSKALLDFNTWNLQRDRVLVQRTGAGYVCLGLGKGARFLRFAFENKDAHTRFYERCVRVDRAAEQRQRPLLFGWGLPPSLADIEDPQLRRLAVAEALLKAGYDEDEPRNELGEWSDEDDDSGATAHSPASDKLDGNQERASSPSEPISALPSDSQVALRAVRVPVVPPSTSILSALGSVGLRGITRLPIVATAAVTSFLGITLFPSRLNTGASGPISGMDGFSYKTDATGSLQIFYDMMNTKLRVFSAQPDHEGSFRDDQNNIVARKVGDYIAIDADAVRRLRPSPRPQHLYNPDEEADRDLKDFLERALGHPLDAKLCPDPDLDYPGGMKQKALLYQKHVSILNNGFSLPDKIAVSLINPKTGRKVHFDDCRLRDGTMIEAKGPGYLYLYTEKRSLWNAKIEPRLIAQARRQVYAANGRKIEWYFAEKEMADLFRQKFLEEEINITVVYAP